MAVLLASGGEYATAGSFHQTMVVFGSFPLGCHFSAYYHSLDHVSGLSARRWYAPLGSFFPDVDSGPWLQTSPPFAGKEQVDYWSSNTFPDDWLP